MRKMISTLALGLGLALMSAAPAQAVEVIAASAPGGNGITYVNATDGLLEADLKLNSFNPVNFQLGVTSGDGATVSFSSLVDVFTSVNLGEPLGSLVLELTNGVTFGTIGSISPAFSTFTSALNDAGNRLTITFGGGENLAVGLGAIGGGFDNFGLDLNGLVAGDNFALSITPGMVPEPATWVQMILGFGIAGVLVRRRRQALRTVAA